MSKSSTTGHDNLTAAILAALAGPPDDAAAALAAVRDVYTAARETTTDPGELDPVEQIVGEALAARTGDESRADNEKQAPGLADRLMAAFEPAHSITAWIGKPTPEPVLWERGSMRANGENNEERECSAYCSVGEPALLSAPGGAGKSYLALAVAAAAVTGEPPGNEGHEQLEPAIACGLGVRPGPVVICSYEDRPVRTWHRLRSILSRGDGHRTADDFKPDHALHVCDDPAPLYKSDGKPGDVAAPTDYWRRLWAHVARLDASLLIIDPASAAVAGISTNDSAPVREFMGLLAAASEATSCGVLIIAHDTKAARNEAALGGNPGAGAVAGSATWYDAARGVLYLHHYGPRRLLRCMKANHGRAGGGWLLREIETERGWFQGFATDLRSIGVLNPVECDGELKSWKEAEREEKNKAAKAAKKRLEKAVAAANRNTEGGPDDEGIDI